MKISQLIKGFEYFKNTYGDLQVAFIDRENKHLYSTTEDPIQFVITFDFSNLENNNKIVLFTLPSEFKPD